MANAIMLIGDWGNGEHYATPKGSHKKKPVLLRECPDCNRPKLKPRQRYCDDCRVKRRRKTNRENQRKYYGKQRVSS